ncbi:hypothetical protein [Parvibaculum sp.]|jgi:hypothetical protein|uniref:hypothetical protein n=1 Tax=Parvibaculum sp. TaxID=2024848 RepID=UPI001B2BD4B9|nr:hypothetical protein [Parvibaculum sp.]MBO6633409.1 hypothetical protein [Parvibaculum sp.]MBO6679346.1 hypothetical protein [Parvibaculum sp.]MBO6684630.1 hypothetical protein [Parvibaculum sp.]MBO6904549.1 hypothetical protein [Parvibaculum sp.]
MKKFVVSAGLAAALGFALPATANAVSVTSAIGVQTGTQVELVHGYKHRHGHQRHYAPPRVVHHYHHRQVRPWAHWRPYVVRHHYHSFGAPVYYSSHPTYGPYYRVRAHDRSDVALWLGISAITGAIIFSQY